MSVPIVDTARAEGLHQKLSYAGHHKDVHSLVPQTEQQKYVHPLYKVPQPDQQQDVHKDVHSLVLQKDQQKDVHSLEPQADH